MSFNLIEFRKRYPVKPYDRVEYRGEQWEAISFPWPNMLTAVWRPEDGAGINIRRPDDPTSMIAVDAAEVKVPSPICVCGHPLSAHRPENQAHHSECTREDFRPCSET